ncbi:MAG: peptidylprolyl isomerase [Ruminococcus sp.]|nr:peptidylprolyl isomerase [Ruminococcus sp.]
MLKRLTAAMVCTFTAASLLTGCGQETQLASDTQTSESSVSDSSSDLSGSIPDEVNVPIANFDAPQTGDTIIEMNIRDYGTVKIRLFPEYAEKGVENFVELAKDGYYDGLTFHRVIKDFMIQGGDPLGNGTGGKSIWGAKFDGGVDPHLIHAAGAVAYANSGSTATNGSQFYIVTGKVCTDEDFAGYAAQGLGFSEPSMEIYKTAGGTPFLDGGYTVFGQVFDGLDIIFSIQNVETNSSDKPLEDVIMDSVKVSEYNGEELKWYISDYDYEPPTEAPVENVPIANYTAPEEGETIIDMKIRDYGDVKIKLFPEYAEKGVENFVELAKKGYYDGLTFHRVIKDFMIQGGDPKGDGTGGESVWGGSFDGGTDNHLIHSAGAVAYANSGSTSTDGSQFYIVTGETYTDDMFAELEAYGYRFSDNAKEIYLSNGGTPFLDGSYTVFGQVYDGLDVIFKVQEAETDSSNDKPLEDIIIESVTVEEYDGGDVRWSISDY